MAILSGDTTIGGKKIEEIITGVATLTHSKSGTVHSLTGLSGRTGLVPCQFKATAAYTTGDTMTVDGTTYTIKLSNGDSAEDNLFVSGATVQVSVDTTGKTVNFKAGGGLSGSKLQMATATTTDVLTGKTFYAGDSDKIQTGVLSAYKKGDYIPATNVTYSQDSSLSRPISPSFEAFGAGINKSIGKYNIRVCDNFPFIFFYDFNEIIWIADTTGRILAVNGLTGTVVRTILAANSPLKSGVDIPSYKGSCDKRNNLFLAVGETLYKFSTDSNDDATLTIPSSEHGEILGFFTKDDSWIMLLTKQHYLSIPENLSRISSTYTSEFSTVCGTSYHICQMGATRYHIWILINSSSYGLKFISLTCIGSTSSIGKVRTNQVIYSAYRSDNDQYARLTMCGQCHTFIYLTTTTSGRIAWWFLGDSSSKLKEGSVSDIKFPSIGNFNGGGNEGLFVLTSLTTISDLKTSTGNHPMYFRYDYQSTSKLATGYNVEVMDTVVNNTQSRSDDDTRSTSQSIGLRLYDSSNTTTGSSMLYKLRHMPARFYINKVT